MDDDDDKEQCHACIHEGALGPLSDLGVAVGRFLSTGMDHDQLTIHMSHGDLGIWP